MAAVLASCRGQCRPTVGGTHGEAAALRLRHPGRVATLVSSAARGANATDSNRPPAQPGPRAWLVAVRPRRHPDSPPPRSGSPACVATSRDRRRSVPVVGAHDRHISTLRVAASAGGADGAGVHVSREARSGGNAAHVPSGHRTLERKSGGGRVEVGLASRSWSASLCPPGEAAGHGIPV